jgi:hypothetical protein
VLTFLSDSPMAEAQKLEVQGSGNQHPRIIGFDTDEDIITLSVPVAFQRRGVETKLIVEGASASRHSEPDPALIKTVARAHVWFEDLVAGRMTMTELATREGMKVSSVAKLLHLAFLAPDIVESILAGTQAPTVVARHLIRADLPIHWQQQRAKILA